MAYDLKSESEVKEYIKNLGIEYRFGCFSEKKPEVCHLLGDYLEAIKKDFEKAGRLYKNNCDDNNYPKSCHKYGTYALTGKGQGKEDYPQAFQYFSKACNLNEADSCFYEGLMQVTNNERTGIKREVLKGMAALEKSCNADNSTACYYVSGMYISGVKKDDATSTSTKNRELTKDDYVVEKNMKKAYELTMKGCELGNMYCCANLSQMYSKGDGIEQNAQLAEKYKKIALEMQDEVFTQKPGLTFQQGLSP